MSRRRIDLIRARIAELLYTKATITSRILALEEAIEMLKRGKCHEK